MNRIVVIVLLGLAGVCNVMASPAGEWSVKFISGPSSVKAWLTSVRMAVQPDKTFTWRAFDAKKSKAGREIVRGSWKLEGKALFLHLKSVEGRPWSESPKSDVFFQLLELRIAKSGNSMELVDGAAGTRIRFDRVKKKRQV